MSAGSGSHAGPLPPFASHRQEVPMIRAMVAVFGFSLAVLAEGLPGNAMAQAQPRQPQPAQQSQQAEPAQPPQPAQQTQDLPAGLWDGDAVFIDGTEFTI